jgi:hypothetical protein
MWYIYDKNFQKSSEGFETKQQAIIEIENNSKFHNGDDYYVDGDQPSGKHEIALAIKNLHNAVKAETGVSDRINDFLIALRKKHEVDLGDLASLDEQNFTAALKLFAALGTQDRFEMWDKLQRLGY